MNRSQALKIASLLRSLDSVAAESVIAEFTPSWQQTIREAISDSSLDCLARVDAVPDVLLQMIEQAVGVPAAGSCPMGSPALSRSASHSHDAAGDDRLANASDHDLLGILRVEHPQTATICLAALAPERAASLLGALGEPARSNLLQRLRDLATLGDDSLLNDVCEEITRSELDQPKKAPGGFERTQAILQHVPEALRQELWASLSSDSPATSQTECAPGPDDLRADFLQAIEIDASLASLEFNRLVRDQWALIDPLIEYFSPETLFHASLGLDLAAQKTLRERLPDSVQPQLAQLELQQQPIVVSEIHNAQVEILRRALSSDSYQLSVWQQKKHLSVSA